MSPTILKNQNIIPTPPVIQTITRIQNNVSHHSAFINCSNIFVAQGGDGRAAFATNFYVYGINFIIYALEHNMQIWFNYIPDINELHHVNELGHNSWNYYFKPIEPSSISQIQTQCNLYEMTSLSLKQLLFLHQKSNSSVHAWYVNHWLRKVMDKNWYYPKWFYKHRLKGYQIVSKYIHVRDDLIKECNQKWKLLLKKSNKYMTLLKNDFVFLGVQMRGTDKTAGRRLVFPEEYLRYIFLFVQYFMQSEKQPKVFLATDDINYIKYIRYYWHYNEYLPSNDIRFEFNNIVIMQTDIIRSKYNNAVFNLNILEINKYKRYIMGKEVLFDILMLSKCDYFIHSASAVAEAVFYNNLKLHNNSIHLEFHEQRNKDLEWVPNHITEPWLCDKKYLLPQYVEFIAANCSVEMLGKFVVNMTNIMDCKGLYSLRFGFVVSEEHCKRLCCADERCNTYLWCQIAENCSGTRCRIGDRHLDGNICTVDVDHNQTWFGQGML
eukprot:214702_1